jgi:hypothetical protein
LVAVLTIDVVTSSAIEGERLDTEYLQKNPGAVAVKTVEVCNIYWGTSSLNESLLDMVDVFRPVILSEIAPGRCILKKDLVSTGGQWPFFADLLRKTWAG